MKSQNTGESWVARPLSEEKWYEKCDPAFEVDWCCNQYGVPLPTFRQTHGTRLGVHGSYNPTLETVNFTRPCLGVVLHETAHHICHKLGLNGQGNWHDHNFGKILQEMIDDTL